MLRTELNACQDGGLTVQRVMRHATLHYHMSIKRRMHTAWNSFRLDMKSKKAQLGGTHFANVKSVLNPALPNNNDTDSDDD
jgi:hypothetical protein